MNQMEKIGFSPESNSVFLLCLNPPSIHMFLYRCQPEKIGFSLEVGPIIITPSHTPLLVRAASHSLCPICRCVHCLVSLRFYYLEPAITPSLYLLCISIIQTHFQTFLKNWSRKSRILYYYTQQYIKIMGQILTQHWCVDNQIGKRHITNVMKSCLVSIPSCCTKHVLSPLHFFNTVLFSILTLPDPISHSITFTPALAALPSYISALRDEAELFLSPLGFASPPSPVSLLLLLQYYQSFLSVP